MRPFAVLLVSIGVLGIVCPQAARTARARHVVSWSTPAALSPTDPSIDSSLPRVAVDARGDAFAVWQEARANGTFTRAAVKPAGSGWGAARTLARGGFVSLAVDARGDAVVAGLTLAVRKGVFAVYRPAGGTWGRAVLLGHLGIYSDGLSAAIGAARRPLVAWVSTTGRIEISAHAHGHWTTQTVGEGADPTLAVNDNGDALVVWHTPPDRDGGFLASWNVHGAGWQRAIPIPFAPGLPVRPEQAQVALDDRGNATVFWTNWDADVFSSNAPRGGAFGRQAQNMQIGYDGFQALPAVAPDGAAALAAVANRGNGPLQLRIRNAAAAGWSAPIVLGQSTLQSALAFDRSGRLLVTWVEADTPLPGYGQLVLMFATGTTASHISTAQTLATIGGDCWMHRCLHGGDPAVAIGTRGHAIVAWVAKIDPNHGGGVVLATDINLSHG